MAKRPPANFTVEVRRPSRAAARIPGERPRITALDARPRATPVVVDDQRVETNSAFQIPERPPEIARRYASAEAALFGAPKHEAPRRHALTPPVNAPEAKPDASATQAELDGRKRTGRVLPSLKTYDDPLAAMTQERRAARVTALSARGGGRTSQARTPRITALSRGPTKATQGLLDLRMPQQDTPWPDDAQIAARKPEPIAETMPPEALTPVSDKVTEALHRKAPSIASQEVGKTARRRKLATETAAIDKAPRQEVKVTLPEPPAQQPQAAAPLVPERAFKYNRNIQTQARRYARTMSATEMQGILKPHERWKMRIPTRLW